MGSDGYSSAHGPDVSLEAFNTVGVLELLEHDRRPTFVLDMERYSMPIKGRMQPVYCNESLRSSTSLQYALFGEPGLEESVSLLEESRQVEYVRWILDSTSLSTSRDRDQASFVYLGMLWTCFTVRDRWRMISGNPYDQHANVRAASASREPLAAQKPSIEHEKTSQNLSVPDRTVDKSLRFAPSGRPWTDILPATGHTDFFKNTNWPATSLGPLESWSYELRQMTTFLMSDPCPACVWWFVLEVPGVAR